MKVAILSFLAFLVATNAGVHKEIIVTNQNIFQLMSDLLDTFYQDMIREELDPFGGYNSISFNLKFDDVDLTMHLANGKLYLGEMQSKSVSTTLTDSALTGEIVSYINGFRVTTEHSTTGTVQGKAYHFVGDLAIRFNYEANFTFGACYGDDKFMTFERFGYDGFVTNPSIELAGLPFEGVVQKEIISLIADELVKQVGDWEKLLKEYLQYFKQLINPFGGRPIQEVYNICRQDPTCFMHN